MRLRPIAAACCGLLLTALLAWWFLSESPEQDAVSQATGDTAGDPGHALTDQQAAQPSGNGATGIASSTETLDDNTATMRRRLAGVWTKTDTDRPIDLRWPNRLAISNNGTMTADRAPFIYEITGNLLSWRRDSEAMATMMPHLRKSLDRVEANVRRHEAATRRQYWERQHAVEFRGENEILLSGVSYQRAEKNRTSVEGSVPQDAEGQPGEKAVGSGTRSSLPSQEILGNWGRDLKASSSAPGPYYVRFLEGGRAQINPHLPEPIAARYRIDGEQIVLTAPDVPSVNVSARYAIIDGVLVLNPGSGAAIHYRRVAE